MRPHLANITFMTTLFWLTSCNAQTEQKAIVNNSIKTEMDNSQLTPESAHPKAKKLLTEDFYWSPLEESGPFGSDDGSEAFYGFRYWRASNKKTSPIVYLKELIAEWGYQPFDLNEMNQENLKRYISASEISGRILTGQDEAIIAIGFGQFVLEGKIDEDIRSLTKTAINRELLPVIIERWDSKYRKIRVEQLNKMLAILDKMNE